MIANAPITLPRTARGLSSQVNACSAVDALGRELSADKRVRSVHGLDVYSVTANDAPRIMQAIGRIRETEFRREGGGTGQPTDLDRFDLGDAPYRQLVVWDAQQQEIVAAYRYALCRETLRAASRPALATEILFEFSARFCDHYLPYTIELGRSVVNRNAKRRFHGLFAAWAGLGALVREHRDIRYFFGKFTTFPSYSIAARDTLLHFLRLRHPDPDMLVRPRRALEVVPDGPTVASVFQCGDYDADYAALRAKLQQAGELIPPLVISYLSLTRTMKSFGTARNPHFGGVDETAVLVPIADINDAARARFIDSYTRSCPGYFCRCAGAENCDQHIDLGTPVAQHNKSGASQ